MLMWYYAEQHPEENEIKLIIVKYVLVPRLTSQLDLDRWSIIVLLLY